ncbi:Bacterioferritin-associated ferredoxin [Oligella sp. MSHR50489EDL]|uniref:(2Fe-2S)-binding protein n=1 Tax=Oligella sp. MSHR50489EDL TaxID=3139409 RepID=UPI003D813F11
MYVCLCNAITDRQIQDSVAAGTVNSFSDLQAELGVATCCGCCAEVASSYLNNPKSRSVQVTDLTETVSA